MKTKSDKIKEQKNIWGSEVIESFEKGNNTRKGALPRK